MSRFSHLLIASTPPLVFTLKAARPSRMKQEDNAFSSIDESVSMEGTQCHEPIAILLLDKSGILLSAAIRKSFYLNSRWTGVAGCTGFIKLGGDTV
jgi:hypothetical protein